MSTDTQNSAPVSAVPQGWRLVPIEPTVTMRIMGGSAAVQAGGSWGDVAVQAYKAMLDAAPVAAQPDLTQQTLDDVKAGIPARDAEITALRKELETLQRTQAQPTFDDLQALAIKHGAWVPGYGPFAAELLATYGLAPEKQPHWVAGWLNAMNAKAAQQPVSGADGFDAWIKRKYPWLGPIGDGVEIAREAWSAALAQQDADKVDAERYRALKFGPTLFKRGYSGDGAYRAIEYLPLTGEQLDSFADAARKEPDQ